MADSGKGFGGHPPAHLSHAGGARCQYGLCRNSEVLKSSTQDSKKHMRAVHKEIRQEIRELRRKRESMISMILTMIYFHMRGNPNLSFHDLENIMADESVRESVEVIETVDALIQGWKDGYI